MHAYNNTFVNTVASFERTERSAVADHFGWHPATGPDVDKREGHIFVGNLLVADETFGKELLRFEQSKALCGKLTRPQPSQVDGNVYLRRHASGSQRLIVWGPTQGENCQAEYPTLDAFKQANAAYEQHGTYVADAGGAIFRSAELKNFEPTRAYPTGVDVPEKVLKLVGWPANRPLNAGAYQQ